MPEPVAPTTAIVEGICSEQLQNSSRFRESILFCATKLRVASKALETVLQVSNILYPSVMLGRRTGLLFISSMANIIACNQRNPRKLYLEEEMEENRRLSGQPPESRYWVKLGLNHGSVTRLFS